MLIFVLILFLLSLNYFLWQNPCIFLVVVLDFGLLMMFCCILLLFPFYSNNPIIWINILIITIIPTKHPIIITAQKRDAISIGFLFSSFFFSILSFLLFIIVYCKY